jgi:ATP-GRASP peptide maturase of grasp-with-spasm system
VIDWILFFGKSFVRINQGDDVTVKTIKITNQEVLVSLTVQNQELSIDTLSSFWYRKGDIDFDNIIGINGDFERVEYFLDREWNTIKVYFLTFLEQHIPFIGNYFTKNPNKLLLLQKAKQVGLLIPETYIISQKQDMVFSESNNTKWITKPIQDIFTTIYKNKYYYSYTENFESDNSNTPDTFFPSQIQEKIEKLVELRIFFARGNFYPMAIFSQNDDKTKVDFRNYNTDRPNRLVPFNLPTSVELCLKRFVKLTNINTGSIDILVDRQRKYHFLEVNPNGQFGMVSEPCNYYIEKQIANLL